MLAQPETDYSYMDTPEFQAKANALIKSEQARYDAWLAEEKFDELITEAKAAAVAAYKTAANLPEFTDEKSTWLEIDLGHRRAKRLVMELHAANIGYVEINAWSWFINCDHVLGRRRRGQYGTSRQNYAALEAFALALSKPGFELKITRE